MKSFGLYFKIFLLVVGLAVVFFVMRAVTPDKIENAFEVLGADPADSNLSAEINSETQKTLCRTRIHAIRFANADTLIEQKNGLKLDWTAESAENPGTPRLLNYLEIEKWFSKHCTFLAIGAPPLVNPEPSNEPVKYVLFEYIDKTSWELYRVGDVLVSASEPKDRFQSQDLVAALEELRSIAGFAVDSKDR